MARIIEAVVPVLKAGYHRMTSPFGPRVDPITGKKGAMHCGVDLTGKHGHADEIIAFEDGIVTYARDVTKGYSPYYRQAGNYIFIKHTNGYYTQYCHMAYGSIKVKKGDTVKCGDVVGYMGTTGKSTGVHLHFGIKLNGRYVDPEPYLLGQSYIIAPAKLTLDKDGYFLMGVKPNTTIGKLLNDIQENLGVSATSDDKPDQLSGTGSTVIIGEQTYTVIVKGDIDGDSLITAKDYQKALWAFLGIYKVSAAQLKAGDLSGKGKITAFDYLKIKRAFNGTYEIK